MINIFDGFLQKVCSSSGFDVDIDVGIGVGIGVGTQFLSDEEVGTTDAAAVEAAVE